MRFLPFREMLLGASVLCCFTGQTVRASSVLTHEALIDALWDVKLKPVLQLRYPQATPEQLKVAHGYAYGGAIIQDLGYYPLGNKQFSNLTHYVRTSDFVLALLADARDLNQLAFALGSLSHYLSDIDVHRGATNLAEAKLYPKLKKRFGNVVTYEQDPAAHLKTEFGFDVLEIARGNFAPQAYHDFIGFYVATDLLQRAFGDTYGLDLADLFSNFDRSVESYRHSVSNLIPKATRIAWAQRRKDVLQSEPGITRSRFIYVMRRSSYEQSWGKQYDRPTAWERFLAIFLKFIPPIGPLRALQFKMPTPEVEQLFMASFDRAAAQYRIDVDMSADRSLQLADVNLDVGNETPPGHYWLEDESYVYWLHALAKTHFSQVTPAIRDHVVVYLSDPAAAPTIKGKPAEWAAVTTDLNALKAAPDAATQRSR
jgi:hypothetical protein